MVRASRGKRRATSNHLALYAKTSPQRARACIPQPMQSQIQSFRRAAMLPQRASDLSRAPQMQHAGFESKLILRQACRRINLAFKICVCTINILHCRRSISNSAMLTHITFGAMSSRTMLNDLMWCCACHGALTPCPPSSCVCGDPF